jgi:hypothetical protein
MPGVGGGGHCPHFRLVGGGGHMPLVPPASATYVCMCTYLTAVGLFCRFTMQESMDFVTHPPMYFCVSPSKGSLTKTSTNIVKYRLDPALQ